MCGEPCELLDGADVVLHRLDPSLGVEAAIRRRRPDLPVVSVAAGRPSGPAREGPAQRGHAGIDRSSSIEAQIRALRAAVAHGTVAGSS